MTKASGRKAHSNGADFEKYLEDVECEALRKHAELMCAALNNA